MDIPETSDDLQPAEVTAAAEAAAPTPMAEFQVSPAELPDALIAFMAGDARGGEAVVPSIAIDTKQDGSAASERAVEPLADVADVEVDLKPETMTYRGKHTAVPGVEAAEVIRPVPVSVAARIETWSPPGRAPDPIIEEALEQQPLSGVASTAEPAVDPVAEVAPDGLDVPVIEDRASQAGQPFEIAPAVQCPALLEAPTSRREATPALQGSDAAAPRRDIYVLAKRAGRYALLAAGAWAALVFVLILAYRFVDPPASALMLLQRIGGVDVHQSWVSMENISPNLIRAVVVSEDNRFCQHWGIDLEELSNALERGGRGASTISMQVSKNLFLWPSRSYLRKAIEVPITLLIEATWPKRRVLEVYLNIAEWGPGLFGAEEAARYHFSKSAAGLSEREAARLAVALPNPITRDAGAPGPGTLRLASTIQARMRYAPRATTACIGGSGRPITASRVRSPDADSDEARVLDGQGDAWKAVVKPPKPAGTVRQPRPAASADAYRGPSLDQSLP